MILALAFTRFLPVLSSLFCNNGCFLQVKKQLEAIEARLQVALGMGEEPGEAGREEEGWLGVGGGGRTAGVGRNKVRGWELGEERRGNKGEEEIRGSQEVMKLRLARSRSRPPER